MSRNSSTLSNVPESLQSGSATGNSFRDFLAEQLALGEALPGLHPVHVAAQRVDLAVVAHEPHRLARSHDGNVFVENREWTIARWLV